VTVDLPLDTNIPLHYIPDQAMRLGLYRRIADARTLDEINALADEFVDRFGPLPQAVENLLFQMKVKVLAVEAGLNSVSYENGQFVLRFPKGKTIPPRDILGRHVRVGKTSLVGPPDSLERA